MVHYRSYKEVRFIGEKEYDTFGVAAFDGEGELITYTSDITTEKEKAELLAEMCEKHRLSPLHLRDVAEDFIIYDMY